MQTKEASYYLHQIYMKADLLTSTSCFSTESATLYGTGYTRDTNGPQAVIESDATLPADVFSHSGGCHTFPPFPSHT